MAKIQYIRTLESIAVRIRDLAIKNAPKDKGDLREAIYKANTPAKSKMIKQLSDLSVVISLDYAPNGFEYGQFFNAPPAGPQIISKQRKSLRKTAISRGNWNYASDAMDDKNLNKEFQAYLDLLGDYVIQEVEYELDKK